MKQIKGYNIDTRLLWGVLLIYIPLLLFIVAAQGFGVLGKTIVIDCHEQSPMPCVKEEYGLVLEPGEKHYINGHDNKLVEIFNYGVWLSLIMIGIYNHIKNNLKLNN